LAAARKRNARAEALGANGVGPGVSRGRIDPIVAVAVFVGVLIVIVGVTTPTQESDPNANLVAISGTNE